MAKLAVLVLFHVSIKRMRSNFFASLACSCRSDVFCDQVAGIEIDGMMENFRRTLRNATNKNASPIETAELSICASYHHMAETRSDTTVDQAARAGLFR